MVVFIGEFPRLTEGLRVDASKQLVNCVENEVADIQARLFNFGSSEVVFFLEQG
jgi:hypothetical protein